MVRRALCTQALSQCFICVACTPNKQNILRLVFFLGELRHRRRYKSRQSNWPNKSDCLNTKAHCLLSFAHARLQTHSRGYDASRNASNSELPRKLRTLPISFDGRTKLPTQVNNLSSFGDVNALLESLVQARPIELHPTQAARGSITQEKSGALKNSGGFNTELDLPTVTPQTGNPSRTAFARNCRSTIWRPS